MVLAVVVSVTSAGLGASADAAPAGPPLQYTCSLFSFADQAMTVRLTWTAPDSIMVGQASPARPVSAIATVGPAVTWAAGLVRAASFEGTVDATAVASTPEGDITIPVPLTVPRTAIPVSGPMNVGATGTTPSVVFHRPGHATISIGSVLTLHLTPYTADGAPTAIGQVTVSCRPDPGQNEVLKSFEITAPAGTPVPVKPTTAPAAVPTTTAPRPTVTPSSSSSMSGTTTVSTTTDRTWATTKPRAPAVSVAARTGPTAGWWLAVGVIVAAVAGVTCGVWWLIRRRRTGVNG
jgi:Family of unknown function (DUF6801)